MTVPESNNAPSLAKPKQNNNGKARPIPTSVLLVEDDAQFAGYLRQYLEAHHFEVHEARDGGEAIRHVLGRDFDVILCDMVMPNFPGEMFYRAVERAKPHLSRRFIFMTGYRGDAKITEFIGKVGGFILWKPFEFRVLLEAIGTIEGAKRSPGTNK
jgi:CheY-like chemotaxis protein